MTLTIMSAGCGMHGSVVDVHTGGEVDPAGDAALSRKATRSNEVPNVKVVQGEIPEGLDIIETGTKMVVLEGYESRYEVLGTVVADHASSQNSAMFKSFWWTWKYPSGGKQALCSIQAPLKLITIGYWNLIPSAYPCMPWNFSAEARRVTMNDGLKKGAAAMGGNMVFLTSEQALTTITISQYGSSSSSTKKAMVQQGFVIKDRKLPPLERRSTDYPVH